MGAFTTIAGDPVVNAQTVERSSSPVRVVAASRDDRARWDEYVSTCHEASGYHVWDWRAVFELAFGHQAVYLMALRGEDVCGVLPLVLIRSILFGRSLTSLPLLNYGGVVTADDEAADALVAAAANVARTHRCGHVELRHRRRRFPALPVKQHKVAMLLDLGDATWGQLDKKVRNQIRKAQKSGLTSHSGGRDLLSEFYAVFTRNMRDLGTPVYGKEFFDAVLRAFPDRTDVHLIRLDGRPVAAAISYRSGRTIEVPWASSVRDYNPLCPNHLLYWSIIELAASRGLEVLDFGRSTPGEGTFKFKEQWGARALALHWEYILESRRTLPDTSPTNPKFQLAIELWKRLPLPLATRIGPRVVRGIP